MHSSSKFLTQSTCLNLYSWIALMYLILLTIPLFKLQSQTHWIISIPRVRKTKSKTREPGNMSVKHSSCQEICQHTSVLSRNVIIYLLETLSFIKLSKRLNYQCHQRVCRWGHRVAHMYSCY